MKRLKVNGIAKGQYKQLCPVSWKKCNEDENMLAYKIRRAVDLGKKTYTYKNGCKIVRYHYHNFLISDNEIMLMWKDRSRKPFNVSEEDKKLHKELFLNHDYDMGRMRKFIDSVKSIFM